MDMDQEERWELGDNFFEELGEFHRVEVRRSNRPDLHAFLLLDELFPNPSYDMVCDAGHDEIYLDVNSEQIASLTDEQILELTRCGVQYGNDGLWMNV